MTRRSIITAAVAALVALAVGGAAYATRGPDGSPAPRAALNASAEASDMAAAPADETTPTMEPELTCEQADACAIAAVATAEPSCAWSDRCDDIKPCRGEGRCAMPIAPCEIQPMPMPGDTPVEPPLPCPPLPCGPLPMGTPGVMPPVPAIRCLEPPLPPDCAISSDGSVTCPDASPPCGVPPAPGGPDAPVEPQTLPCIVPPLPPNCVVSRDGVVGCPAEPCGAVPMPDGAEKPGVPATPCAVPPDCIIGSDGSGSCPGVPPMKCDAITSPDIPPVEPLAPCSEPALPPGCTNAGAGEGGCPGAPPPAP